MDHVRFPLALCNYPSTECYFGRHNICTRSSLAFYVLSSSEYGHRRFPEPTHASSQSGSSKTGNETKRTPHVRFLCRRPAASVNAVASGGGGTAGGADASAASSGARPCAVAADSSAAGARMPIAASAASSGARPCAVAADSSAAGAPTASAPSSSSRYWSVSSSVHCITALPRTTDHAGAPSSREHCTGCPQAVVMGLCCAVE